MADGMQHIKFDVMADGYFVRTLIYSYCPLFKFDIKDLEKFALTKLPTLKYRKNVEFHIY